MQAVAMQAVESVLGFGEKFVYGQQRPIQHSQSELPRSGCKSFLFD